MERISLDQCFLPNCDNQDIDKLEPLEMEEHDDDKKNVKIISIKCHECNGIFKFKLETIKYVAKPTKSASGKSKDEEALSMGLVHILDENDKNLGHLGYF